MHEDDDAWLEELHGHVNDPDEYRDRLIDLELDVI